MPGDHKSHIPQRLVTIAARCLPGEADTDAFWRHVDAEIVPDFRSEIQLPIYDEWLALQLGHSYRRFQGISDPSAALGESMQIDRLLRRLEDMAVEIADSRDRAAAKFIHDQLEDRHREWTTDRLAPYLGRPNRKFIREILRRAAAPPTDLPDLDTKMLPETERRSTPPFDRLPTALMAYVLRNFPRESRESAVWNRVREFVYPHFDETLLSQLTYRKFLRLLVRFHALKAPGAKLLPEARGLQSFLQALSTDAGMFGRGSLTDDEIIRIKDKVEDLVATLQSAERAKRPGDSTDKPIPPGDSRDPTR